MSSRERPRLADIQAAIDAIRIPLLEIGEAVKALPDDLLAAQPSILWRQVTRTNITSISDPGGSRA